MCVLIDEVESLTAARRAAVAGSEPADAVRAVNALLTQLDALKRRPNILVRRCLGWHSHAWGRCWRTVAMQDLDGACLHLVSIHIARPRCTCFRTSTNPFRGASFARHLHTQLSAGHAGADNIQHH